MDSEMWGEEGLHWKGGTGRGGLQKLLCIVNLGEWRYSEIFCI